jgi:hypothetical protein
MSWLTSLLRYIFTPPASVSTDAEMMVAEGDIEADVVEACGKLAMTKLLGLWEQNIFDPRHSDKSDEAERCRGVILHIITHGGGWKWVERYKGDGAPGNEQWCGFTQAEAWADWIPEATRRTWWASCYRLDKWARYSDLDIGDVKNPKPKSGPLRGYWKLNEASAGLPDGYEFQVGDVALVGDGRPDYGDHVVGLTGYDPKRRMFHTLEGNGVGKRADGTRGQGIVKAERPIGRRKPGDYHVRRIIRPASTDLLR